MLLWGSLFLTLLVAYGLLCALFYFGQDYFFFRPERLPQWFAYKYSFPFSEVHFEMDDGATVNGIHFEAPNSLGVVFYVKGNSRSIKGWGKFAKDFLSKGYDFFIMDYRGFGKSRGHLTEKNLYADLQEVYNWLRWTYGEERITLYGRSLGSGLAAWLAAENAPKRLLLDCPYYSFLYHIRRYGFWMPLRWLLRYHIRTDRYLPRVKCPVAIVHGARDRLIPARQGRMLRDLAPDNISLCLIEGAGHNNLPEFAEYHEWLYDQLCMPAPGQ